MSQYLAEIYGLDFGPHHGGGEQLHAMTRVFPSYRAAKRYAYALLHNKPGVGTAHVRVHGTMVGVLRKDDFRKINPITREPYTLHELVMLPPSTRMLTDKRDMFGHAPRLSRAELKRIVKGWK